MRWLAVLLVLLLVPVVFAQVTCTDGDDGPSRVSKPSDVVLSTKASVKYGLQEESDVCVTGIDGVSADKSLFLREYYCDNNMREHEDYDCSKYGFTGCEAGACVGKAVSNDSVSPEPVAACGDRIVEKDLGEECDPPSSICFGDSPSEYGQCNDNCKCEIAKAAKAVGSDDMGEMNDSVSNVGVAESNKSVANETVVLSDDGGASNVSIDDAAKKDELPEVHPVDVSDAKNFSDDVGIKATSSIANFFKRFFNWLAGLFS